jgi:hypothetical protein
MPARGTSILKDIHLGQPRSRNIQPGWPAAQATAAAGGFEFTRMKLSKVHSLRRSKWCSHGRFIRAR